MELAKKPTKERGRGSGLMFKEKKVVKLCDEEHSVSALPAVKVKLKPPSNLDSQASASLCGRSRGVNLIANFLGIGRFLVEKPIKMPQLTVSLKPWPAS